ncbi:MAG: Gfo/Idh/MocA family oxidoreductase [Alphaproteobacteria bacterium]|nr:Gfo/Idh/MocA family oxidoreductase [Alphaproteobacteria bacterium]MBU1277655.1 Gfo/Idh/MocA family oxidoreductase [Alphaproteobacteria bacterium]MBU1574524.1 Gfo/Idh/MocA family oxidoreductase [Alphaproteobacteria bacterium]MBU1827286.1 Gfo/Idh/MocA family oxidoreductase [Alphaproteobacteria bacterium]MBU2079940.1 Gfo/Idh/MocA family oxidoreductase [Alphaproteobacteria bacterium]
MSNPVRFGVLGGAKFALDHMARAIHEAEGAQFTALATSSLTKAAPFQAFCPGLNVFTDYDAMLASDEIDAVYIPLPNHLHVEWSLKALAAGKHVLCEKPIAMKAAEIDALIAKRDESGLVAAEAFMIVHHPQWARVKEMLSAGEIGDLIRVDVAFSFDNPDLDNIRNKPGTGGGAMGDIGVYAIGSVRFATGQEPEAITSANITYENGVDVTSAFTARFAGFDYSAYVSMRMSPFQEVRFHGRTGVITVKTPFNAGTYGSAELHIRAANGITRIETFPTVRQYVVQVENFVRSARDGADYPWSLENARGTQAMIDAVFDADQG